MWDAKLHIYNDYNYINKTNTQKCGVFSNLQKAISLGEKLTRTGWPVAELLWPDPKCFEHDWSGDFSFPFLHISARV
jgi:hypothetical protein